MVRVGGLHLQGLGEQVDVEAREPDELVDQAARPHFVDRHEATPFGRPRQDHHSAVRTVRPGRRREHLDLAQLGPVDLFTATVGHLAPGAELVDLGALVVAVRRAERRL